MISAAWKWLVAPANALTVSAIGLILGAVGFAITLGGFFLALRRIHKLETAAEAAQAAVEGFKLRVIQYDAANDAAEARYALQSTKRHLNNDGWRDVSDTYEDARRALARLLPSIIAQSDKLGSEVELVIIQIDKHCSNVERAVNDPSKKMPDKATLHGSLRRQLDVVHRVQQYLEQRAV